MSENLRWYTKALYGFDHVVRLAPDAKAFDRPSPCAGWTGRDVVGHVLAIQRYIAALIAGTEPPMNPMESPGANAGSDPAAAWASARDEVLERLDHAHVLGSTVTNYKGEPEEVDHLVGFNVLDTTVHSWDLARALGVDDRLDAGLVARAWSIVKDRADSMRAPMVFGPRVDVLSSADPQTVLLAATGRSARDEGPTPPNR